MTLLKTRFSLRLLTAFFLLGLLILAQGGVNAHIAAEAERQVMRGRVTGDLQSGFLELSSTKQRLRAWSLRALMGAPHDQADGEMLRDRMTATIARLQDLSRQSRSFDPLSGPDHDLRDEALGLLADSVVALQPALRDITRQPDIVDARAAWARIETVFDRGTGRDLREVLDRSILAEADVLERHRDDADAALARLRLLSLGMAGMTTLLALLLAAWAACALHRPIREMVRGARAYEEGALDHRIPVRGQDEFARFAASINRMAAELARRRDQEADQRNQLEDQVRLRTAELSSAMARLHRAEANRRRLLNDISHELRTPLTAIRGEAEVSLRGPQDASAQAAALDRIAQVARQMGGLIDDLLSVTRDGAQAMETARRDLDVAGPLEDALLHAMSLAARHDVRLTTDLHDAETRVTGDPKRLRQLMTALLDNAVCYARPGGHVHVASTRADASWCLTVRDDGIGVPPGDLPHVFGRNFRADNARSHRPDGTGLGLAIARDIAVTHGGDIALDSPPGGGTIATLRLPVVAASLSEEPE